MDRRKSVGLDAEMLVGQYDEILSDIVRALEESRRAAARSINTFMTATYWSIGRRIVEHEQRGEAMAEYGERLVTQLARDLTARLGRGFSRRNLFQMRAFYQAYREKVQTASAQSPLLASDLDKLISIGLLGGDFAFPNATQASESRA